MSTESLGFAVTASEQDGGPCELTTRCAPSPSSRPLVEVSVRRGRYPTVDGVLVHRAKRLDPCDVTEVDGIPVTSVARTLCDLGAVVPQDAVEAALDSALRRGVPVAS
jgi:hypothetical protein